MQTPMHADLSKNVNELEVLSTYPESETAHSKRMAALQAEMQQACSETERLTLELRMVSRGGPM